MPAVITSTLIQLRFHTYHFNHPLANILSPWHSSLSVLRAWKPQLWMNPCFGPLRAAAREKSHHVAWWCHYKCIATHVTQGFQRNCQSVFFFNFPNCQQPHLHKDCFTPLLSLLTSCLDFSMYPDLLTHTHTHTYTHIHRDHQKK